MQTEQTGTQEVGQDCISTMGRTGTLSVKVGTINDSKIVQSILDHPRIAPWINFGTSQLKAEDIFSLPHAIPLLFHQDATVEGMILLLLHSPLVVEQHTCLLPGSNVKMVFEALVGFLHQIGIRTVITHVPSNNRHAKIAALRHGYKVVGVLPNSYLTKDGEVLDQFIMILEV